jgi:uncharacterized membrane protein
MTRSLHGARARPTAKLSGGASRSQRLLAVFFTFGGTMHFVRRRDYEAVIPPYIPRHRRAVAVSGVAEILGGLAVVQPSTRPLARWCLLALLVAVFPANVYMATNPGDIKGLDLRRIPRWALWARLPLQPLIMWWVWQATEPRT